MITFLESSVVKYRYYKYQNSTWYGAYTVSTGENGTNPRITTSYGGSGKDSVYFMWQKAGTYQINHRRYELTSNSWSSILTGHTVSDPNVNIYSANLAGFRVTSSTIVIYFAYAGIDQYSGNYWDYFNWVWRNKSDNSFGGIGNPNLTQTKKVYSTTTFDNNNHSAFYYVQIAGGEGQSEDLAIRRSKSTSGYPDDIIYDYNDYQYNQPMHINVSSAGNEVHAIWKDDYGNNNGNNLRYKYDDQAPLAPQNLSVTKSANNHPLLSWSRNNEADLSYYTIEKYVGEDLGWVLVGQTSNLFIEDVSEHYCTAIPPMQCPAGHIVYYRAKAYDIQSHSSAPSNSVGTMVQGGLPYKIVSDQQNNVKPDKYSLNQNYPNPFNPSTIISYSIKEEGLVTLKVYDILGKEIATLVNENKPAGIYETEFNASQLPSGIYIYKIQAGSFTDVKKMLLTK
ncbi:MAG TPA: T9SS type A sorting domain-containing protein [Ignavibacteriaceae bacterium]|nr:T9SS type A sorting domain-containing protein [Ignavibacteriaceae bacterium]